MLCPIRPGGEKCHPRLNESVMSLQNTMSLPHLFQLQLHSRINPVTAGLGVMSTYLLRAAAYKLVPLGVMLGLWPQWPLANT